MTAALPDGPPASGGSSRRRSQGPGRRATACHAARSRRVTAPVAQLRRCRGERRPDAGGGPRGAGPLGCRELRGDVAEGRDSSHARDVRRVVSRGTGSFGFERSSTPKPPREVLRDRIGTTPEHERDLAHVHEREHDDREHREGHRGAEPASERVGDAEASGQRAAAPSARGRARYLRGRQSRDTPTRPPSRGPGAGRVGSRSSRRAPRAPRSSRSPMRAPRRTPRC